MEPIRTAVAGLGRAGWGMHCSELEKRPDKFTIVAACDPIDERLNKMEATYGCHTYKDIEKLAGDTEVELVTIATRSTDHARHADIVLQAGKYAFLEKPVAITMDQVRNLKSIAEKYPGRLFFCHNRRFEPAFQHIREILDQGLLGEPYEIKLRRHKFQRRGDWQTLTDCGGGQLNNWGPHIIDHALRLLGSPVAEVWSDLKNIAALGDAEDHLKIVFRGTNDRVVDLEISGGAAIPEPQYLIFGDRGALQCDGSSIKLKHLNPRQKLADLEANPESREETGADKPEELDWIETTIDVAPQCGCAMGDIWDHLFSAVREGKAFPITTREGLEVAEISCRVKEGTRFERTGFTSR